MTERYLSGMGYRFVWMAVLTAPVWLFCTPGCRTQVENKIIAQSTLYPFHFVDNDSRLNAVGRYDLDKIVSHYKEHPGELHVRQGEATPTLYSERITQVVEVLKSTGIKESRINVTDVAPEENPAQGERVIEILPVDDNTD